MEPGFDRACLYAPNIASDATTANTHATISVALVFEEKPAFAPSFISIVRLSRSRR